VGYHLGYVWTPGPQPGVICEGVLPLTDGIEGVGCTLVVLPQDARIPARVGPGLNRSIFRYLTYDDGVLTVDGYVDLPSRWYSIAYNAQRLWISNEDFSGTESEFGWLPEQNSSPNSGPEDCFPPLVAVPPISIPPTPEGVTSFQDFPVYHCRHLGSNQFEWVSARVTYDADGIPISEEITGGPFQGEWRDGCPAGEITVQPGTVGEHRRSQRHNPGISRRDVLV
jgi:hypothetical protein